MLMYASKVIPLPVFPVDIIYCKHWIYDHTIQVIWSFCGRVDLSVRTAVCVSAVGVKKVCFKGKSVKKVVFHLTFS